MKKKVRLAVFVVFSLLLVGLMAAPALAEGPPPESTPSLTPAPTATPTQKELFNRIYVAVYSRVGGFTVEQVEAIEAIMAGDYALCPSSTLTASEVITGAGTVSPSIAIPAGGSALNLNAVVVLGKFSLDQLIGIELTDEQTLAVQAATRNMSDGDKVGLEDALTRLLLDVEAGGEPNQLDIQLVIAKLVYAAPSRDQKFVIMGILQGSGPTPTATPTPGR